MRWRSKMPQLEASLNWSPLLRWREGKGREVVGEVAMAETKPQSEGWREERGGAGARQSGAAGEHTGHRDSHRRRQACLFCHMEIAKPT